MGVVCGGWRGLHISGWVDVSGGKELVYGSFAVSCFDVLNSILNKMDFIGSLIENILNR